MFDKLVNFGQRSSIFGGSRCRQEMTINGNVEENEQIQRLKISSKAAKLASLNIEYIDTNGRSWLRGHKRGRVETDKIRQANGLRKAVFLYMGHLVRAQAPDQVEWPMSHSKWHATALSKPLLVSRCGLSPCHCFLFLAALLATYYNIVSRALISLPFLISPSTDHDSRLNCQEDALWPIMISTRNLLCHYSYGYSARHH